MSQEEVIQQILNKETILLLLVWIGYGDYNL